MSLETTVYQESLRSVIDRLVSIADALTSAGFHEEAMSVETNIAVFVWQFEELESVEAAATRWN